MVNINFLIHNDDFVFINFVLFDSPHVLLDSTFKLIKNNYQHYLLPISKLRSLVVTMSTLLRVARGLGMLFIHVQNVSTISQDGFHIRQICGQFYLIDILTSF